MRTNLSAYVGQKSSGDDRFIAELTLDDGTTRDLLLGDPVNVINRGATECRVRARGVTGTIAADRLTSDPLLEICLIDVGQGDGVLIHRES